MTDFHGLPMAKLMEIASSARNARALFKNAIEDLSAGRIVLKPLEAAVAESAEAAYLIVYGLMKDVRRGFLHTGDARDSFWFEAFRIALAHLPQAPRKRLPKKVWTSRTKTLAILAVGRAKGGGVILEFGHHPLLTFEQAAALLRPYLEEVRFERRGVN